ncbi:MAG: hypothetical protein QXI37_01705, partial [Thermoprotei archaeon]
QASMTLKPLTFALVQVKKQLQEFVPEVARGLDAAARSLTSVLSISTPDVSITDITASLESESVDEILEEVAKEADLRLKQSLESVDQRDLKPVADYIKATGIESANSLFRSIAEEQDEKIDVSAEQKITAHSSSAVVDDNQISVTVMDGRSDLQERVYSYIKKNNGIVDVYKCSKEFGVDRAAVRAVLKELESQGRIKLDVSLS